MSNHWQSHRAYHWSTQTSMHVNEALRIRNTERARGSRNSRDGDCWCCEDCYMSGRGVRRFPCDYESGSSGKTNHFRRQSGRLQDHPTRGAIEGTQCRAEERANSRGEDSSTHNYKDFVNDLIHHFRSDRPSREYDGSTPMQYFHAESIDFHEEGGETTPDITIAHSGKFPHGAMPHQVRIGREETQIIVVNTNLRRRHHFYRSYRRNAQPDRVIIDVGRWTKEELSNFERYGIRKLKDEWFGTNEAYLRQERQSAEEAEAEERRRKAEEEAEERRREAEQKKLAEERKAQLDKWRGHLIDLYDYVDLSELGTDDPHYLSDEQVAFIFGDPEMKAILESKEQEMNDVILARREEERKAQEEAMRESMEVARRFREERARLEEQRERRTRERKRKQESSKLSRSHLIIKLEELRSRGIYDLIPLQRANSLRPRSYTQSGPSASPDEEKIAFYTSLGLSISNIVSLFSFECDTQNYRRWSNGYGDDDDDEIAAWIEGASEEMDRIESSFSNSDGD